MLWLKRTRELLGFLPALQLTSLSERFAFMQLYNIQSKPVLVFPSNFYRLQNTPLKSCLNFNFSIMLHFLLPYFLKGFIRKPRGFLLHSLEFAKYFPATWKSCGGIVKFLKRY